MAAKNTTELAAVCDAFADGLQDSFGERLCGLYVYGAAAFPETEATGDIDFHALLARRPTNAERAAVFDLEDTLARRDSPLGAELDGYYLLLSDARRVEPPADLLRPGIVDNAWALHRAHLRAGRCIVLLGPDPGVIYPPASWVELEAALWDELAYVEDHLDRYPDYCILNLFRIMLSFRRRDVVISKWAAARWAVTTFPQWKGLVEQAKRSYLREALPEDRKAMQVRVRHLLVFARGDIASSQSDSADATPLGRS